ncbi:MAG: radical SAM family heme chaperone HemW [Spirochaetales bacterium]|jgi:oxygen-independent coproporphyrinogen-3 oxidase|nr:radical SAM family heme chaperone HemW [Spirochaetales bacterium]
MDGPAGLSLYLHIPFCRSKCGYCGFYSCPQEDFRIHKAYLDQLLREARIMLEALRPAAIPSLYIGGGTPTVIAPGLWDEFLEALFSLLPGGPAVPEATMEANPESLTPEHLEVLARRGINRLSLGVQSFSGRVLKLLGRRAGEKEIRSALDLIRENWSGRLSLDLITEAPGQGLREALFDLEQGTALRPDHLSLYLFTLEEGSAFFARPPKKKVREDLFFRGLDFLAGRGFVRYEVSNFYREGAGEKAICRHNLGYWRMEPYLGLGAGAASTLPGRFPGGSPRRRANPGDWEAYLEVQNFFDFAGEEGLSPGDFLTEYLLMGFRLLGGIEKGRFVRIFGRTLEDCLPDWCARHGKAGDLEAPGPVYRLTERGLRFMNPLLREARLELDRLEGWFSPGPGSPEIHWP